MHRQTTSRTYKTSSLFNVDVKDQGRVNARGCSLFNDSRQ